MCRHASWVQLGTPLKTRPTGTFHLSLEYTDDSFNFLLHPNKFPHLHVETKNRGFLFFVFFFFVFAPCGRNSVYLPHHFWASHVVKTLFVKKKQKTTDSLVFLAAFAFSPLFPPIKKTKISRHWDDATECWESVLRSAHLRAPRCFAASR